MSQYELSLVEQKDISRPLLWELKPLLQKAIDHNYGEMSADDFIESILAGAMQLWVDKHILSGIPRGIGVTRLEEKSDGGKLVRVILYTNESTASYLEQAESFENWCLLFGADEIEFWGREGWKRALKPLGYELKYVVMRKTLGGSS